VGGVLSGFAVIGAVVGIGYLLGRWSVLGPNGRDVLSALTFNVASPALLFQLMSASDLGVMLSTPLLALVISTLFCAAVYGTVGAVRRWGVGRTTIGALLASYVNSGNLGIPIAVYVLGDATLVAPVMLFQLVVYTPIALTVIDAAQTGARRTSVWKLLSTPLRNPVVIGAFAGVIVSATGVPLWHPLADAVELIAAMSVPAMLLAYGISLRGAEAPGRGGNRGPLWLAVGLKTAVQPTVAWLIGTLVFDFDGPTLLGVVVLAALPAAQNIFTYAWRYDTSLTLARDGILITTTLAPVALTAVAALLG